MIIPNHAINMYVICVSYFLVNYSYVSIALYCIALIHQCHHAKLVTMSNLSICQTCHYAKLFIRLYCFFC